MDPVSLGFTLSFAMEAYENGLLTLEDSGGLDLQFGNNQAALETTRRIVYHLGLGDLLAEGSRRAAVVIGKGAEQYVLRLNGLEMVPFEPRSQTNLALGYCIFAIAPTRALSLENMTEMLSAITGWETSSYEILRWGERRNHLMRVYNNRVGLTSADDWLPERFFDEPIDSRAKQGVKLGQQFSTIKLFSKLSLLTL